MTARLDMESSVLIIDALCCTWSGGSKLPSVSCRLSELGSACSKGSCRGAASMPADEVEGRCCLTLFHFRASTSGHEQEFPALIQCSHEAVPSVAVRSRHRIFSFRQAVQALVVYRRFRGRFISRSRSCAVCTVAASILPCACAAPRNLVPGGKQSALITEQSLGR